MDSEPPKLDLGEPNLNQLLSTHRPLRSVVAVTGPHSTFKKTICVNYLQRGLVDGESALLLRFADTISGASAFVPSRNTQKAVGGCKLGKAMTSLDGFAWDQDTSKYACTAYEYPGKSDGGGQVGSGSLLLELAIKRGHISAEECMFFVRRHLEKAQAAGLRLRRVAVGDLGAMVNAHPGLNAGSDSGRLFLTSLVRLLQLWDCTVVMYGTSDGLREADDAILRAERLADHVLRTSLCDVFGDRHVVVTGPGLVKSSGDPVGQPSEYVPAVVQMFDAAPAAADASAGRYFKVDTAYLEGLVGFDAEVHRPGENLHVFSEDKHHDDYNEHIATMLEFAMASPQRGSAGVGVASGPQTDVRVIPFTSTDSEHIHRSIGLLQGAPLDRTVVCTVDEFMHYPSTDEPALAPFERPDEAARFRCAPKPWPLDTIDASHWLAAPYYSNVTVIAYRSSIAGAFAQWTWEMVENASRHGIIIDDSAPETWSCLLLDAIKVETIEPVTIERLCKNIEKPCDIESIMHLAQTFRLSRRYDGSRERDGSRGDAVNPVPRTRGRNATRAVRANRATSCRSQVLHGCGVFIGWYSQLRGFLDAQGADPAQWTLAALPNGGFRGDWYLGVVRGSLSMALGRKVIAALCSAEEDFKRFQCGVGLPTRECSAAASFPAWPGAVHCKLANVADIYKNAGKRSNIDKYQLVRGALVQACERLTVPSDRNCSDILTDLSAQIRYLATLAPSPPKETSR